jgi:MYXO-CTERM domain-containing protein
MSLRSTALMMVGGLAAAVTIPGVAAASPRARLTLDAQVAGAPASASVCGGSGAHHCHAHVRVTPDGEIIANAGPPGGPDGFGPAEIQSAYQIDPAKAKPATVAIVDAYGYANLESDLATYRAQFGLPPCTIANGCLEVVNQNGATAPLPPNPPANDDWTIETALDVDMVSAMCPSCKILVVQADDTSGNMYIAQNAAAAARPTAISDSWGAATDPTDNVAQLEPFFDHPGIAQFVSAGDSGYNEGGKGPAYPSISAHVIAVGGTRLVQAANQRGWSETAWTKGGSSCSFSIPKPAYQTASPCAFRAASDIAAVGDPATGVAVFNADNGGWMVVGGTSAAAPLVAALFAASGLGSITAAQIAQKTSALFDVTSGSNGPCGNLLCNAAAGWDGPTGFGTPSAAALTGTGGGGGPGPGTLSVMITSPADGDTVDAGFTVTATASSAAVEVGLVVDGTLIRSVTAPPYAFQTPRNLTFGQHLIQVAAIDAQSHLVTSDIHVVVKFKTTPVTTPEPETGNGGGCSVGNDRAAGSSLALVAVAFAAARRRRRV